MAQVILNIPDKELDFFMTLVQKFKYQLVDDNVSSDGFVLSKQQMALLDKRSKTPIDNCISAADSLKQLKKKHGI